MPRRLGLVATMVLAASAAPASCLEQPDLAELLTKPVIVTKRDPNASFATPRTFAITDSIPLRESLDGGATGTTVDPAIANPTLDEISAQLTSRGYQRVDRTEGPDLGVAVTGVNKLNVVTVNYGAWWGGGAASPNFWGYPGGSLVTAVGYSSIAAWQSGTLIIELYDLRAAREAASRSTGGPTIAAPPSTVPITVIWAAIIHGVIGPAGSTLQAPPIEAIRQAFTQSSYLTRLATP